MAGRKGKVAINNRESEWSMDRIGGQGRKGGRRECHDKRREELD